MIFNVPRHIVLLQNGLLSEAAYNRYPPMIVKTQTRRVNRGIYQVGHSYSVQPKRGAKAVPGMRIMMDKIWEEKAEGFLILAADDEMYPGEINITQEDALAEGGYTPNEFEEIFRELNPKWDGKKRWVFKFHVISVKGPGGKE